MFVFFFPQTILGFLYIGNWYSEVKKDSLISHMYVTYACFMDIEVNYRQFTQLLMFKDSFANNFIFQRMLCENITYLVKQNCEFRHALL